MLSIRAGSKLVKESTVKETQPVSKNCMLRSTGGNVQINACYPVVTCWQVDCLRGGEDHGFTEYPDLAGTHKDQSSAPGPAQNQPQESLCA